MDDMKKIVDELKDYPLNIHMAMTATEEARAEWAQLEAQKDHEYAGAFLKAKAMDLTDGEARQKSTQDVYTTTCAALAAESCYRKAIAEQTRLENEFIAVRKMVGLHEAALLKTGSTLAEM